MGPDLDTLATALYVRIDGLLAANPGWAPERPAVGFAPKLSDAELVTLAVISALLGFDNESRFVRFAKAHLRPWFPYLPNRRRLQQAAAAQCVEQLPKPRPLGLSSHSQRILSPIN